MQAPSSLFASPRTSTSSTNNIILPLLLLLLSSFIITNTLASPINGDTSSESAGAGTRSVYIVIQDHGIRELTIATNGDFAWDELPSIDIPGARILNEAPTSETESPISSIEEEQQQQQQQWHTTCFFWRSHDEGAVPYARGDAFVSQPLYSQSLSVASQTSEAGQSPILRPYRAAERIYCYDSTAEQANQDVITVFMQNSQEEQKLVRLPVSAEEKSYAVTMSPKASSSSLPGSPSPEVSVQDSSLQEFSDRGVTGLVLMYVPKRDSYCIADAGPREMFAIEFGIVLKFQPGKKVFELDCRY